MTGQSHQAIRGAAGRLLRRTDQRAPALQDQNATEIGQRAVSDIVEDKIVSLCLLSEILLRVVHHKISASDRTNSTFLVLQTPVTSALDIFAICTASRLPTPPAAPLISTF